MSSFIPKKYLVPAAGNELADFCGKVSRNLETHDVGQLETTRQHHSRISPPLQKSAWRRLCLAGDFPRYLAFTLSQLARWEQVSMKSGKILLRHKAKPLFEGTSSLFRASSPGRHVIGVAPAIFRVIAAIPSRRAITSVVTFKTLARIDLSRILPLIPGKMYISRAQFAFLLAWLLSTDRSESFNEARSDTPIYRGKDGWLEHCLSLPFHLAIDELIIRLRKVVPSLFVGPLEMSAPVLKKAPFRMQKTAGSRAWVKEMFNQYKAAAAASGSCPSENGEPLQLCPRVLAEECRKADLPAVAWVKEMIRLELGLPAPATGDTETTHERNGRANSIATTAPSLPSPKPHTLSGTALSQADTPLQAVCAATAQESGSSRTRSRRKRRSRAKQKEALASGITQSGASNSMGSIQSPKVSNSMY